MSLNDQYEELELYLQQAENEISQVFERKFPNELANFHTNGTRRRIEPTSKADHTGPKVHFSESTQVVTGAKHRVKNSKASTLKSKSSNLKSCLKESTMRNPKDLLNRNDNSHYRLNNNGFIRNGSCKNHVINDYSTPNTQRVFQNGNGLSANNTASSRRNSSHAPRSSIPNPQTPPSQDLYHQDRETVRDANEAEENIITLIESIKADIEEMKEKYENDEEEENNKILTKELDEILNLYKIGESLDKETDILSDLTSSSSYNSTSLETVQNAIESPSTSFSSSSPCLTVVTDNELTDDNRSTSSSDSRYLTPNWSPQGSPQVALRGKSSSAPVLKNQQRPVNRQARSQSDRHLAGEYINMSIRIKEYKFFRSLSVKVNDNWPVRKAEQLWRQLRTHKIAEIEAAEACRWLRSTGFPQYAQMYEDMQFPVDISTAKQDHPRLEADLLNALYRRLQILNNCVHLHQQRAAHTDDSEDENCAISKNWTFQSDIRRWSRACITDLNLENDPLKTTKTTIESENVDEDHNGTPKERIRRGGSVKFRRRREGVVISDSGAKLLDSLSEQLSGISMAPSASSDSELTPKFYSRLWRKPSEKESNADNTITIQIASVRDDETNIVYCKFSSQQLGQLERIAMLKLTAYIEKYCPTHRTGWNWEMPRNILRRIKNPAYKESRQSCGTCVRGCWSILLKRRRTVTVYDQAKPEKIKKTTGSRNQDKTVFGVPIQLTLQRTGYPLPRNIENALDWLQRNAVDQVGLFRKSGVRSRIQALRNAVESSTELLSFEDQQPYDVADMVKQYFRDLPEALLTNKLSETFKLIFQFVPAEHRLDAVLCGIFLMPDEHIEVLQVLISFLTFITRRSEQNQMNENNLATCFAPSLFHYAQLMKPNLGAPHPKDLAENRAAHDCLQFLLENHQKLFTIPRSLVNQCNPAEMKEWKVLHLNELGKDMGGWKEYLRECEQAHLKEVKDKSRGWTLLPGLHNSRVEVYYKKIDDGLSVRVWKVIADIDAPPTEVMHRILRERHLWDMELVSGRIIVQLDQNSEIFQYGRKRVLPSPNEEYCVVRQWRSDLPKDSCMIVETSVEHQDIIHIPNSIRGIVHASRYFIEPCGSGRSRIFHMCRADTMGRKPEYYYKNYGHVIGFFISKIQSSFYQEAGGPESKV